ncbi:GDSL-type esterase/lipase family protein [Sulfobacillus thermosulfidooxidans]|uniref:GDSL-type esterase/lipase family protein n=1 Tax=Sulfobacillus thermosulfidooxidans TaxID=28034 RepID=UPI0009E6B8D0|nr:GDSL-type esterase/lipase family protein [Sulfobacillus thermosulfidooxidans]
MRRRRALFPLMAGALGTFLWSGTPLFAASSLPVTLYVSPQGSNTTGSGSLQQPYQTINYALSVAPSGATVVLLPGVYHESPIIAKPITLKGEPGERQHTIIDAKGYNNAVLITGTNASGTQISHLTLENANNQDILGVDASHLLISHDTITQSDQNPTPSIFEDKAITLMGSTGSIIRNNMIVNNPEGGITLTDDGMFSPGLADPLSDHPSMVSEDNQVSNNIVENNPGGCGIVVGSFNKAGSIGNQILNNTVSGNAQGIDIGVAPMGSQSLNNVVSGNVISHNSIPGVLVHLTAPGQIMSGTIVRDNTISDNGPDPEFHLFKPSGIALMGNGSVVKNTTIEQNIINQEYYGIWSQNAQNTQGIPSNTTSHVMTAYTVATPPLTINLQGPTGQLTSGASLTYNALASESMLYQFWLQNPSGHWTVIQNYSKNSQVHLSKLPDGTYTLVVYGMTPAEFADHDWHSAVSQSAVIEVGSQVHVSQQGSFIVGQTETVMASSSEISHVQYQFWLKTPEGQWISSGAYGAPSFKFTPEEPGTYQVVVYAKPLNAVANASEAASTTTTMSIAPAANSLVALGDSISFGYNLGSNLQPSPLAFPYLIGQQEHLPVNDLAVPGWTSTNLLTALKSPLYLEALKTAKVVTIDIGSNDLLSIALKDGILFSGTNQLTPAEENAISQTLSQFRVNLGMILTEVHQAAPQAHIVLYNIYNPFPTQMASLHNLVDPPIVAMNQIIAKAASAFNIPVANAYQAFDGHEQQDIITENVHPSVVGQETLATLGEQLLGPSNP